MITDINSEDRLVQETFANHLHDRLDWESVYAYNNETFGPGGTLGRASEREIVLVRDLRAALNRLNPTLPTQKPLTRLFRPSPVLTIPARCCSTTWNSIVLSVMVSR